MVPRILVALLCSACTAAASAEHEVAFTIWDWTAPCRDLDLFDAWVADLASLGFTRVEISAPWRLLEPAPGDYDFAFVEERLAIAESHGLGMRVRINSYYQGATPHWYEGANWRNAAGETVFGGVPSIMDAQFWASFGPMCTALAEAFAGRGIYWSPFIGIHAELKWADWWHFDEATQAAWQASIEEPRPEWLRSIVGRVDLPGVPPVPPPTAGDADTTPAHLAVIAFREQCWREAVSRFVAAVRAGDPDALVSAPLGESYRRGSAQMGNLDYWGLSRGANQVVHSYDFFWHAREPAWKAAASVAAFQGITGLPVVFELDGPILLSRHGYSVAELAALGRAAHGQGAGLNVSNWSYTDALPSTHETVQVFAEIWRTPAVPPGSAPAETTLFFLSKWVTYQYREADEWLHKEQFGLWHRLREGGAALRVVSEDNLAEDLTGYKTLVHGFPPSGLLPDDIAARLSSLDFGENPDVPAP